MLPLHGFPYDPAARRLSLELEGLDGLDGFTLARAAQIQAKRRAVMAPMTPPPAPTPGGQDPDQAAAFQAAWQAGWNAGRGAGWQQGWDLRSAVEVLAWYLTSGDDL